jgi:ABC-2 type transport system permease protein
MLRNRRTLMFIGVFPTLFFFMFALSNRTRRAAVGDVAGYLMISMAVYGSMVGTTTGGAAVAVERSLGWTRQLRLTPLHPATYIAIKVLTAMVLGFIAVGTVFLVGAVTGVRLAPQVWLLSFLAAWLSSLVFAAFGLFMGFLLPSENVMQFVGPVLAIFATFGGVFIPVSVFPPKMQMFAEFIPVYGVGELARAPLSGGFSIVALVNVAAWTLLFGFAAMILFRRDTGR